MLTKVIDITIIGLNIVKDELILALSLGIIYKDNFNLSPSRLLGDRSYGPDYGIC